MQHQLTMDQILFCAQTCNQQQTGELSVYNMVNAYWYALCMSDFIRIPTDIEIRQLARFIDPVQNKQGYRTTLTPGAEHPDKIQSIINMLGTLFFCTERDALFSPADPFTVFKNCKPFITGNHRIAAILYNWINNSLLVPVHPTN